MLYKTVGDSHYHLFFRCPYARRVWNNVKEFDCVHHYPDSWDNIDLMLQKSNSKRLDNQIHILIFAATCYFVRQERNRRIHKRGSRTEDQLYETIIETVRLKIYSIPDREKDGRKMFLS